MGPPDSHPVVVRYLVCHWAELRATRTAGGTELDRPDRRESQVVNGEPADYGSWWSALDDPALDQLVDEAYRQNLSLQGAAVRILEARAGLAFAAGLQFPQRQGVGAEAAAVRISETAPNAALLDRTFFNFQLGFDAEWELDAWGRFGRGVEAAYADYLSAVVGYDAALVTVTGEVARAYVLSRTFEGRLELAQANVEIQRETLRIAEVRQRFGAVGELDVTQARALLRDTEALIPVLDTGIRQSRNALSILIGRPPEELEDVMQLSEGIPTPPVTIAVGAPVDLLRRRPDVRFAEFQAAAQSARIGIAQAEMRPRFTLFGSIGLATSTSGGPTSNSADLGSLFSLSSLTYFVGPRFSFPLFNYGRLRNNVRIQDARYQQLALNYQNTVLEAAREVEDALTAFCKQVSGFACWKRVSRTRARRWTPCWSSTGAGRWTINESSMHSDSLFSSRTDSRALGVRSW